MTHDSFNLNLPGDRAIAEIDRDAKTVVYRAERIRAAGDTDRQPVAIKVLASADPTERELGEFCHHYAIAKNLHGAGCLRLDSLVEYERGYALVMEDWGISLQQYCQEDCLSPIETIEIAIQLADILHTIGRQSIVHKNIQPAQILIHPQTKQVKLIDFSIASILPSETPALLSPNLSSRPNSYRFCASTSSDRFRASADTSRSREVR
jgi:serine/threonine protein kinase